MQRWREQYLGLAEFLPAMAIAEVDQFFTLNWEELAAVETRRGPLNRLSVGLQIGFLRMTGRTLNSSQILPTTVLEHLGRQLDLTPPQLASIRGLYRRKRIFALLFGSAAAFDAPARQTFVAELVGDEDLHNAVALNSTSSNAARMVGPAVSGVVIAAIGTGWAFLINGVSFVAVLIALAFLRVAELRPNARARRAKGSFTEGFRYVWGRPDLGAILVMLFLIGTFGLNFPIFILTMAVSVFHADARGYGLLSSIMAIGTVAGALLGARREKPQFPLLLVGAVVFGLGCSLAAIAPGYWFFAGALAIIGVAALTFTNTTNSLMQLSTEPAMRGRVMALRVGIALGGTPIGAPIVGWVANHCGPRWALGVGAASGFAAAIVAAYALARPRSRPSV